MSMLVKEFDTKLDMQCILTLDLNVDLFNAAKKFNIYAEGSLSLKNGGIDLYAYIPVKKPLSREVEIFIASYPHTKLDSIYSLKIDNDQCGDLMKLRDLLLLKSVIVDDVYYHGGLLYVIFRFHSSQLKSVSDFILKTKQQIPEVVPEYLGKSPGLIKILEHIDNRIPLYYISLDTTPPPSQLDPENNPLGLPSWTREIEYLSSGKIGAIYCTTGTVKVDREGVDVISERDGVFRVFSENPILEFLAAKMSKMPIMAINRSQRLEKSRLRMDVILPQIYASTYLDIVSQSIENFPEWGITLAGSCRFSYAGNFMENGSRI